MLSEVDVVTATALTPLMDCEEMLNSSISAAARIMEEGTRYTVNGSRDIHLYIKFTFFYPSDWKVVYVYYFDNDMLLLVIFVFGYIMVISKYMYIKRIVANNVAIIYIYLVCISYIMINHLLSLEFLLSMSVNGILSCQLI